jgi:two-component system KDP operon response regulator KdpE
LRHGQPQGVDAIFHAGNLEVDLSKRLVLKDGAEVKLTPIEYSLLRLLVTHAGKVLTHRQLLTEVWGEKAIRQSHYLRVHMAHLREKLEANPAAPELIVTEPAIGYRLVARS